MSATLEDALQNALLFAGDARTASGGLIKVSRFYDGWVVEAYDDFTYVRTEVAETLDSGGETFYSAKEVRLALRTGLSEVYALGGYPDPGCFGDAAEMVSQPVASMSGFYLSVDRWKKLGGLKPSGLPMEFRTHSDAGFPYGSFRYGSSVGLLSFLDRDVLEEEGLI